MQKARAGESPPNDGNTPAESSSPKQSVKDIPVSEPGNREARASLSDEEERRKEFNRARNAVYSRRKYQRKKIEIEVLQQQSYDLKIQNEQLKKENLRLEQLFATTQQKLALIESLPNNPQAQKLGMGGTSLAQVLPTRGLAPDAGTMHEVPLPFPPNEALSMMQEQHMLEQASLLALRASLAPQQPLSLGSPADLLANYQLQRGQQQPQFGGAALDGLQGPSSLFMNSLASGGFSSLPGLSNQYLPAAQSSLPFGPSGNMRYPSIGAHSAEERLANPPFPINSSLDLPQGFPPSTSGRDTLTPSLGTGASTKDPSQRQPGPSRPVTGCDASVIKQDNSSSTTASSTIQKAPPNGST